MPDIDVEAVELTAPPASAPQTSYTPAVLVRNNGVSAVSAFGYLQLFDLDSGLWLHTWTLASSSIPPGETKNAYADATWSPLESDVGKQFVFSGWVTCEGDMVPGNNPVDPVLVTVTEEPPPPPPPVTAHATQHEDGGTDELNVDGLSGTLGDPQPIQDHAAKHMVGGDDEIDVTDLDGALLDPQIPTDHGNERHAEEFATTSELANHLNDADPHNPALLVPVLNIPASAPSVGASQALAPAEHRHGGEGGMGYSRYAGPLGTPGDILGNRYILAGCLTGQQWATVRTVGMLQVDVPVGPGDTLLFELYAGADLGAMVVRGALSFVVPGGTAADFLRFHFLSIFRAADFWCAGEGCGLAAPGEIHPHQIPNTTAGVNMSADLILHAKVSIPGTATVQNVLYGMNLDYIELAV